MDTDNDGKVSKQEFKAFGETMRANAPRRAESGQAVQAKGATAPTPPSPDEVFAKADADGDGSLNIQDLSAMLSQHETHAAARGSHEPGAGAGGPPPRGAGGPPPGGGAGGSGATTDSKSSSSSANPDPADTDHDGKVSAAEKLAYQLSQLVNDTTKS